MTLYDKLVPTVLPGLVTVLGVLVSFILKDFKDSLKLSLVNFKDHVDKKLEKFEDKLDTLTAALVTHSTHMGLATKAINGDLLGVERKFVELEGALGNKIIETKKDMIGVEKNIEIQAGRAEIANAKLADLSHTIDAIKQLVGSFEAFMKQKADAPKKPQFDDEDPTLITRKPGV